MSSMKPIVLDLSQPANAGPLRFYQAHLETNPAHRSTYDIDDYVLHTHPDLVDRFIKLSKVPDQLSSCLGAAYGYPVLVNPINNILFATAISMDDLLIRLPEAAREGVLSSFSKDVKLARDDDFFMDFGEDWIAGDAWKVPQEVLFSWLTIAYAFTGTPS